MNLNRHFRQIFFVMASACILLANASVTAQTGTVIPKIMRQTVTASPAAYHVTVAGQLDRDNCITRSYGKHDYAYRTDVMLAVENRGANSVKNPRVTIGGRYSPRDIDEMLDAILQGCTDPQEKIYRIWNYVRENRHHDYPVFGSGRHSDELHDPVKYLLIYGGGFCDDTGSVLSSLACRAGFNRENGGRNPIVRTLHGHMMAEIFHDGGYQFMDADENAFYLDRENRRPVSGDAAARDHDLVHREIHFGPQFTGWERSQNAAALFGKDDGSTERIVMGHSMDFELRPGERIEYLWEYRAGYPAERPDIVRRHWWNSRSFYCPPLTRATLGNTFDSVRNFAPSFENREAVLQTESNAPAELEFHIASAVCDIRRDADRGCGMPGGGAVDGVRFTGCTRSGDRRQSNDPGPGIHFLPALAGVETEGRSARLSVPSQHSSHAH